MTLTLNKPLPVDDMRFISDHVDVKKLRSMYGVVTGATGWFGQWICSALDFMGCEYGKVDTRHLYPFKADYVIHLARGGVAPLINILNKSDVQHILFTSSGAVYDAALTGICAEKKVHEDLFIKSGLPVNIARCFSFTGAGVTQRDIVIGHFIKACLDNKPMEVSNPYSIRTFMYMSYLVIWLLHILLADKGNIYDVGGDEKVTLWKLADILCRKLNTPFNILDGEFRIDDPCPYYVPHLQFAHEDLGLQVRVDLDTAIDKTIEWERNAN